MSSKVPCMASVKISEPATNATPRMMAKALSRSRSLRATRLRQVTLSTAQAPAGRAGPVAGVAGWAASAAIRSSTRSAVGSCISSTTLPSARNTTRSV
jgi:hypothetical protein